MAPRKETVRRMFDDISPKYDLLNHLLSLGTDFFWRRRLVAVLSGQKPLRILDMATGTGDVAIALARLKPDHISGLDISEGMLDIGRRKIRERGLERMISFRTGEAENIPFPAESFDAVTVAFGVRNYEDLEKGLSEMARVLVPGGMMVILEFSHTESFPMKQLYGFYSRYVIPVIGKMISKHDEAYRYLPESVAAFPSGKDFLKIMERNGVLNCQQMKLTSGIASLYTGFKPVI